MFVVTFSFPGGSANCFAPAPNYTPMSTFLGAVLFRAAALVHALSFRWQTCAVDGFCCPHACGSLLFVFPEGSANCYAHVPVYTPMSTFLFANGVF